MSKFKLSTRSQERLKGVNEQLANVVRCAIQITEVDFGISEGLRTKERQQQLVNDGKSTTINSRHLTGDAVDLYVLVNGKVNWQHKHFRKVIQAMIEQKVQINAGGLWRDFLDSPHFELNKKYQGSN